MKFAVPNWHQSLIAKHAGLDPSSVAVRFEDDARIVFLQYDPRQEVTVNKTTGEVRKI